MLSCLLRRTAAAVLGLSMPFAWAQNESFEHEVWLASGFRSHHMGASVAYNEHNAGVGAEWRFTRDWQLNAGHYNNSMSHGSTYVQAAWMPIERTLAPHWRLRGGASVGIVDGYPPVRRGRFFPTLVPALSLEWRRVGLNLLYIPSIGKRVDGAIALQVKARVI